MQLGVILRRVCHYFSICIEFEGSLCEWESSVDELNPEDPRSKRYLMARRLLLVNKQRKSLRWKRSEAKEAEGKKVGKDDAKPAKGEKKPIKEQKPKASIVLRSWHNWVGRYKNSLTGIARAGIFHFAFV